MFCTYTHIPTRKYVWVTETTSQKAWLFHEPTTEAWRAVGYRDWHNIWAHEQKSCLCVSETVIVRVCVFVTACINIIWNNKSSFDCVCHMVWGLVCLSVSSIRLSVSVVCLQVGLSHAGISWLQPQLVSRNVLSFILSLICPFIHPSSFADSICYFF